MNVSPVTSGSALPCDTVSAVQCRSKAFLSHSVPSFKIFLLPVLILCLSNTVLWFSFPTDLRIMPLLPVRYRVTCHLNHGLERHLFIFAIVSDYWLPVGPFRLCFCLKVWLDLFLAVDLTQVCPTEWVAAEEAAAALWSFLIVMAEHKIATPTLQHTAGFCCVASTHVS